MNLNTKTIFFIKSIFVLGIILYTVNAKAVWMPPTQAPTGGNTSAPLNVGIDLQEKIGSLIVRGLRVFGPGSLALFDGQVEIQGGNPGVDKVLASTNNNGLAVWKTLAELGGGGGSGMINPMTTLGDMIYGEVGGVPTRLPIGSEGQVLSVINGKPNWQTLGNPSAGGWTDDGTVVRLTTATDKVGIGLTNPTEQLQITQNMRLPDTSPTGNAGVIFFGNERFLHNPGTWNTFVGKNSGQFGVTGDGNTGVGESALKQISSGDNNSALGYNALSSNTTGSNNVALGKDSLKLNTGSSDNTGAGVQALLNNNGGNGNSGFGSGALSNNTSGNYNTGIGKDSLNTNSSGSQNTALGYNADVSSGGLSNATAIGANTVVSASDTMVFGNSSIVGWGFGAQPGGDAIKVGGPGTAGNGARLTQGGLWTDGSDRILKYDIKDTKYGLDTILKLRPVDYKLKIDNTDGVGFIAQEVKPIIPELVFGQDGEMTLSYGQMTAVLTKAVQELKTENDELKARIEVLKEKLGVE